MTFERGFPLSRLTTIGTGGAATAFARPGSLAELRGGAALTRRPRGSRSSTSASARTSSPPTRAWTRSSSSLEGELAEIEIDERDAARGRRRYERGLPAPGARGRPRRLRVRVRDPRDRRRRREDERGRVRPRLERRAHCARSSSPPRAPAGSTPTSSASRTGIPSSLRGSVVARVEYRLEPQLTGAIKATVADLIAQRKATQPTNKRTFGSVFKNPPGELGAGRMLEECGLKGHRTRRRRRLAEARELHRERGRRDDGGLPRAHGRGAAACARAVRSDPRARGRARRRHRASAARGRRTSVLARRTPSHGRGTNRAWIAPARARGKRRRPVSAERRRRSPRPRSARSLRPLSVRRSGRDRSGRAPAYWLARESSVFAVERVEIHGASPLSETDPRADEACARQQPARGGRDDARIVGACAADGRRRVGRPRLPAHAGRAGARRASRRGDPARQLGVARERRGRRHPRDPGRDAAGVPPALADA